MSPTEVLRWLLVVAYWGAIGGLVLTGPDSVLKRFRGTERVWVALLLVAVAALGTLIILVA